MHKPDLIKAVAEKTGVSQETAKKVLDGALDTIQEALAQGDEVVLMGFGQFKMGERAERQGRNLHTGEPITIPASKSVRFKPGKALQAAVQG